MHVLIPSATAADPTCQQLWASLELPNLERLLNGMEGQNYTLTREDGWLDPVQQMLAQHFGLEDCPVFPAAAIERLEKGLDAKGGWAHLRWCHLQPGMDDMTLYPPHTLHIELADAEALLRVMSEWMRQEHITLYRYDNRGCWMQADWLADMPSVPLRRVACQGVSKWIKPKQLHKGLTKLLMLQNEVQMLLHGHPINEAREAKGLKAVNSFWVTGAGALPEGYELFTKKDLQYVNTLEQAMIAGDWKAWTLAWKDMDNKLVPQWQHHMDKGMPLDVTLCGDAKSFTWMGMAKKTSVLGKMKGLFSSSNNTLKAGMSWRKSLNTYDEFTL